jgi:type I restriction enzyme S subunit
MSNKPKTQWMPKLRFPGFRDDWEIDDLGKVADFINEKISLERISLESYVSTENILADYAGVNLASKLPTTGSVTRFKTNDTLVSNIRPYLKKVWVANKCGGASNDVIIIRAKPKLLPQYLSSLLKNDAFIDYVMTGAKGVKMPRGDVGSMKAYAAPHPTKPEQQKIADCLSSLDELIAAQARKVDALKTHKKGLMQQLFPREGETQPRLRFPDFRDSINWSEKPFGDFLLDILDFRGRTPNKLGMEWGGGEVASLSANNVKNGFIDYAAECNMGGEELYQRWMGGVNLEKGDIIFTMEAPLGKATLLPDSNKYILSQRVVAFKTCSEVMNEFLVQVIWGDEFQKEINQLATGSTAKGINQKALKTVRVKLPCPKEQQSIADSLTSLDSLITAATQAIETLKTHKQGLMQQLFPSAEAVEA